MAQRSASRVRLDQGEGESVSTYKGTLRQYLIALVLISLVGWFVTHWLHVTGEGDSHPRWSAGAPRG
jgi:hypothetical protein